VYKRQVESRASTGVAKARVRGEKKKRTFGHDRFLPFAFSL